MANDWIPPEDWETIVRNVPIVSVDLVVRCPEGIVLGKRANRPAKGEWFVPGGRVRKRERLTEAVHRLAEAELGAGVTIRESLGAYEHIYDSSDVPDGDGKHYLANGFVVETDVTVSEMTLDDQHESVEAFDLDSLPADLHAYTVAYLADADALPEIDRDAFSDLDREAAPDPDRDAP